MGLDFFISYASDNRGWAEWVAVQLEEQGYSTKYQAADFRPGSDFVHEMQTAASSADRTIAILSPAYLRSEFGEAEWRAAFAKDPTGERRLLIPVRVQPCDPPGLLATRVYVDLVDASEPAARKKLLAAAEEQRPRRTTADFPGPAETTHRPGPRRFPGAGPATTNLPPRNPVFTGRDELIMQVYRDLRSAGPAAVVSGAVHGLGGVGKTTLAVEYAYRFASDYDVIWWIDAEQPATVASQVAQLGGRLGVPAQTDEQDALAAVLDELRRRDRWLLIYDNAEEPSSLTTLVPAAGSGHVLVTSRWPDWRAHARTVQVEVWPRAESVAYLRHRTRHTDDALLSDLSELVGDLPLAVEEAAAYLELTGEDLTAYLELVRDRLGEMFATPAGDIDQRRVATVWTLSLDRVHAEEPVAEELLTLLAFLGPQVPRDLPTLRPDLLPDRLSEAVSDRLRYNRLLAAVGRYALVTLTPTELGTHRLVQAVVQARLTEEERARWITTATDLIDELFPMNSWDPSRWEECERLLTHALAVCGQAERAGIGGEHVSWLLYRAGRYLAERGQYSQAERLARRALAAAEAVWGSAHSITARCREGLGRALRLLGRPAEALAHFELALAHDLAARGPDHHVISSRRGSLGLALQDLGRFEEARDQHEQALAIGLVTLGPGHVGIAVIRNNLGLALSALGRLDEARDQQEQALAIGLANLRPDDHTIGTRRNNLGLVLRRLGRFDEARDQYEQALAINLAALGPHHPTIGIGRGNLGNLLRDLGRLDEARSEFAEAYRISLAALGAEHPLCKEISRELDGLAGSEKGEAGGSGEDQA